MALKVLVDNDALIKLAHWHLLDRLVTTFDASWEEIGVLASIGFRARKRDAKLFRSNEVADELAMSLAQAGSLDVQDPEIFSRLQEIVGLDAGEVELIAACVAEPGSILITGDKRALEALAQPDLENIAAHLAGRVICVEQLLVMMADGDSPAAIIDSVVPYRDIDRAIACVIGASGCTDQNFRDGRASYISDLRSRTGALLQDG
jgi:hypothetical protein